MIIQAKKIDPKTLEMEFPLEIRLPIAWKMEFLSEMGFQPR